MATTKKKSTVKAFIDIGKVAMLQNDGKYKDEQEYVVIAEDLAKYIGASYTVKAPPPITVTRGTKTFTKEVSVNTSGRPYKLGYVDKVTSTGKGRAKKVSVKYKWITIHIPQGAKLRTYINALMTKAKKKPIKLMTPNNVTTRLFDTK